MKKTNIDRHQLTLGIIKCRNLQIAVNEGIKILFGNDKPVCSSSRHPLMSGNKNFKIVKGKHTFSYLGKIHLIVAARQLFHYTTILEKLDIDLISGMLLDPMHLTDLGVTRKLFVSWIRGKYRNVKLTREKQNLLAKRIDQVRSYIPDDFSRKLGPLDLLDRWKSTCFRMMKLRLGPVFMRDILSDNLSNNFFDFHVAMTLLSNQQESARPEIVHYCSGLLKHFIEDSIELYGMKIVSANVHNLIHLTDDARRFGNLDSFSAYPFENYLQIIENLVRKSANPLPKIVKRLSEIEISQVLEPNNAQTGNGKQYKKANFKTWKLSSKKPNNCVYLNDLFNVIIENFVKHHGQLCFIGRQFEIRDDLYRAPLRSSQLGIYVVKKPGHLKLWSLSHIKCKAFIVPSFFPGEDSLVVSPLFADINVSI
ncbi:hypothetical protein GHT06_020388 [Daphnia sinensis]|uniref:Uncharacterized protein n=1 Tax=Daphnia sinensis TaxID=1820382 RepID=A0AAD5PRH3_9CRUS|nr:hypothetical protein GHT06_020388 [Daphnia sinensis]